MKTNRTVLGAVAILALLAAPVPARSSASSPASSPASSSHPCSPFHDSLDDLSTVKANQGVVSGSLTFSPGVKGNAADLDGKTSVTYTSPLFNSTSGSIAVWFKRRAGSVSGGIVQIGEVGTPNSLGVFYNGSTSIYYEFKTATNTYIQVEKAGALAPDRFTHIVAMWDRRGTTYHIKLFVNGIYADGTRTPDPFTHTQGALQLGRTGFYQHANGAVDEVCFFNRAISDPEVYAEYVYSSNRFRPQATAKPESTGKVKVRGKTLLVDGKPFLVKGVGYQPIPIGKTNTQATLNDMYKDPGIIQRDLPLLRDMHVNTVRLWGALENTTLLDALYNNGDRPIRAILGFDVPWNLDYGNAATIQLLEQNFKTYVNRFKDHPAVLAWAIGNEPNLHYKGNVADWFVLANRLARVAYEAEGPTYHPSILVNGYMLYYADRDHKSDDISLDHVDVWGHNTYTGYGFHSVFDYHDMLSSKPLILTEFGIDAYDSNNKQEYQQVHADWVVNQWREIEKRCAGGTLMAYSDEWHKAGTPSLHDHGGYYTDVQPDGFSNEEWWGVAAVQDHGNLPDIMKPRPAYHALAHDFDAAALTSQGTPKIGATIRFLLTDPDNPAALYVLALALANSPGIPIRHRILALSPDNLFFLTLYSPGLAGLTGSQGRLDSTGTASVSLAIPPHPGLAGLTVFSAFVTLDFSRPHPFQSLSDSHPVKILGR